MREERLSRMLELIRNEKVISTKKLKRVLNVSEATVRRDLAELSKRGVIQRIFGGAVIKETIDTELSFNEKMKINIKEKKAIAEFASTLVKEEERIFLESGTTVMYMIRYLRNKGKLFVVTNCLNVAMKIIKLSNIKLTLVGGELREKTYTLIGPLAETAFNSIFVDKSFIGVDGIDVDHGLTSYNSYEAQAMRILINNSKETYVLADHTKFGKFAHFKISSLKEITAVITDSSIDRKYINSFENLGIKIFVAPIGEI